MWLGLEGLGLGLEEGAMHRTRFEGDIISLVRERKEGVYLRSAIERVATVCIR